MKRLKVMLANTVWVMVALCITASASASNIVVSDEETNYPVSINSCVSYYAAPMEWNSESIIPEDYGIKSELSVVSDSYGGNAYIWNDGLRELFVTDYGYAGYYTDQGTIINDILLWYGDMDELQLNSFDLESFTMNDAENMANDFLKTLCIEDVVCVDIRAIDQETARSLVDSMRHEGYDGEGDIAEDAYVLKYTLEINGVQCDAEFFTMANQRDIEGFSIKLIVTSQGVALMEFTGAYYVIEESYVYHDGVILSYDEALRIIEEKFDNLILSDPIEICDVKLQYVLLPVDDEKMAYIPCWCFATPRGSSNRYVWYRFNAYSGCEII